MKQIPKTKPQDPLAWLDDAPERATRWRNLYFMNSGQCVYSPAVHPSLGLAQQRAKEAQDVIKRAKRGIAIRCAITGVTIYPEDFSHHMQIPVKDAT